MRRRNVRVAALLVTVGVVGNLLLQRQANIETLLAVSLFAGIVLRRAYVVLVPIVTVLISSGLDYGVFYRGVYEPHRIAGLVAFLLSGYLFVTLVGTRVRQRTLFRTRTLVIATTASIPLVIAWDVWTVLGEWYFISPVTPLLTKFYWQVPFTLMHLISTLIFVPLVGAGLAYFVEHVLPAGDGATAPSQDGLELPP